MRLGNRTITNSSADPSAFLGGIYQGAEEVSSNGQETYVRLTKVNLFLLMSAAICGLELLGSVQGWRVAAAVSLVISAFLTRLTLSRDYRERWYSGRALAESLKTLSWKYATGAGQTPIGMAATEAQDVVAASANQSVEAVRATGVVIVVSPDLPAVVTDKMREVRVQAVSDRWNHYLTNRLSDQANWYAQRARDNADAGERWSWGIVGLELFAAVAAIVLALNPKVAFNPICLVSTIAAAGLAWQELRRFEELHQAYATTAYELRMILDQHAPTTDDALRKFVDDAEQAISREHTLWIARRRARVQLPNTPANS